MPRTAAAGHEDKVRARAHEIWERAGRPDGQHLEHWQRAEAEIAGGRGQRGGSTAAKPKAAATTATKRATSAKTAAAAAPKAKAAPAAKPAKAAAKPKAAAAKPASAAAKPAAPKRPRAVSR